ncbi:MAG: ATP phosphoribosyltransferase [Chloroflexota bacterium]
MTLRFAIPSKGSLYDGTLAFLEGCGLKISRPNPRRYTAHIRTLPDTEVLLHRPDDVIEKVAEGEIDIGISGFDLVEERRGDRDDLLVLYEDIGFGRCELVVAVPETWIDVSSWRDLADLSVELHWQGRPLRIATKFIETARRFCYAHGINYFRLVDSRGATEASPGLGYADMIIDITETGTTLRDNQLKIVGPPILRSQACLIGHRGNLSLRDTRLSSVKTILELIEARRHARLYVQVVANVPGQSIEDVGLRVSQQPELAGMQGPTIAPMWHSNGDNAAIQLYTVTVIIPQERVLALVDHIREMGGGAMAVIPTQYVFESHCVAYDQLIAQLEGVDVSV